MPAQKRSHDHDQHHHSTPPPSPSPPALRSENNDSGGDGDQNEDAEEEKVEAAAADSDGSDDDDDGSSVGDEHEFVEVQLSEIRKDVQCPICLGIIRKTRTVMECLHRFCRECIDKSMRLGNNECPACRTHCPSRRSLRDDPNYDTLIGALYPDIDKYEEQDSAFHEEEMSRNKQLQDLISQTLWRQSEALGRKRTNARATAAAFVRRSQRYRNLRGRRNQRGGELQGSDEEDVNAHDGGQDSSSADEHVEEVELKRYKRSGVARSSQTLLIPGSAYRDSNGNDSEARRDKIGASAGLVGSPDMLAWGGGGIRSNSRHGCLNGGSGKIARNIRLSKLVDRFLNSVEDNVSDIHLMLVPLDAQRIPRLQSPELRCRPNSSIKHLCQYVAENTAVQADEVEMLLVKEIHSETNPTAAEDVSEYVCRTIDPCKDELHILEEHETLAELQAMNNFNRSYLLLAYRQKLQAYVNS